MLQNDSRQVQPDVSIIIVNWNTRELLCKCIATILDDSSKRSVEIIVVDNGSSDGSVRAVTEKYPEVRVIQNDRNLGFARANNCGIRIATGRYICLSNSDIEVLPGCLDGLIGYMDQHTEAGMIGPKTLNANRSLRKNCKTFPTLRRGLYRAFGLNRLFRNNVLFADVLMEYFDHASIREVDVLPGCFLMVRRNAMEKVGLLDDNFFIYGEDKDWCRRFKAIGWKVVFFPGSEVIHLAGKSSAAAPVRFLIERLKANEYYWLKHHGPLGMRAFLIILFIHHWIRAAGGAFAAVTVKRNRWMSVIGHLSCCRWIALRLLCNGHVKLSKLSGNEGQASC